LLGLYLEDDGCVFTLPPMAYEVYFNQETKLQIYDFETYSAFKTHCDSYVSDISLAVQNGITYDGISPTPTDYFPID